jgi:hypothetical protein
MKEETETEILERVNEERRQLEVKITINGVYALPQDWKDKSADETPSNFMYEICVLGMDAKGGKVIPRALTEEEREEHEANSKNKGKTPAPKGKQKEEEITTEEQERLDKEKNETEEKERRLQEEWDALDEDTKFYKTYEDSHKEPSIKFQIEVESKSRLQTPVLSDNNQEQQNEEDNKEQNEGDDQVSKTHLESLKI